MLTHGKEIDVLDRNDLVVLLIEARPAHHVLQLQVVAPGKVFPCLGYPLRGACQPLPIRVLTNLAQEPVDQILDAVPGLIIHNSMSPYIGALARLAYYGDSSDRWRWIWIASSTQPKYLYYFKIYNLPPEISPGHVLCARKLSRRQSLLLVGVVAEGHSPFRTHSPHRGRRATHTLRPCSMIRWLNMVHS
ncbi:hypothetical protein ES703_99818 [subsurface metagenome]